MLVNVNTPCYTFDINMFCFLGFTLEIKFFETLEIKF